MAAIPQLCYTASRVTAIAANLTRYYLPGDAALSGATAEAGVPIRAAGTVSNLYCYVYTNTLTASTTFRSRKNAANGSQSISIGASTTGNFRDTTNSDTIVAGDKFNYQLVTGATGTSIILAGAGSVFAATTNTAKNYVNGSGSVGSAASTTYFTNISGSTSFVTTTEADDQFKLKTAGTLKNFALNVSANGRTTASTVGTRIGGVNGTLVVSPAAAATGLFEDTTHTDAVSVGSLVNYRGTTGTGTTGFLTISSSSVELNTTTNKQQLIATNNSGSSVSANNTTYFPAGGALSGLSSTENDVRLLGLSSFTASLLECRVSANTVSAASTLRLRKNGANGNSVASITASTTGWFEDAVNSDTVTATDLINYSLVAGTSGTSLTLHSIGMLVDGSPLFAASQTSFRFYEDGTESGSTAVAAQDTNITRTVTSDSNLALRLRLQETAGVSGATTDDYKLQYSSNGGTYVDINTRVGSDWYDTSNQDSTFPLNDVTSAGISQSFTSNGETLTSAAMMLSKLASPTGNAVMKVYAHSGTFGTSSIPTGAALATSDNFAVSALTTTQTLTTFTFSGANQIALTNGTKYCVAVEYTAGDATNGISVGLDGSSPTHAGNRALLSSGTWIASAGSDAIFYVNPSISVNNFNSANLTDSAATTNRLGAGTGSFVAGEISEDGTVDDHQLTANNYTEHLYSLTVLTAGVSNNDTLDFRVLRNGAVLNSYTVTPRITVSKTTLQTLTKTHTTDTYTITSAVTLTRTFTTDVLNRKATTKTHTTDTLLRKATTKTHTTNSLLRAVSLRTFTTDILKRAAIAKTHTTSTYLRKAVTKTHTTDTLLRKSTSKTHTTNSLLRIASIRTFTTDILKRSSLTKSHTTNTYLRKTVTKTHTTDTYKRAVNTRLFTTDVLKRFLTTKTHTTDTFTFRRTTKIHTSDTYLRKNRTATHTTSTFTFRRLSLSHTTDTFLRKARTVFSTSDTLLRKARTLFNTSDSLLRKTSTRSHTTGTLLRKVQTTTHTTSTYLRKSNTRSHTTNSLLRKALILTHSTSAMLRATRSLLHTTNTLLKLRLNISHTTNVLLRALRNFSHTTSIVLRTQNTKTHTTQTFLRKVNVKTHNTSAQLRKQQSRTHTTSTFLYNPAEFSGLDKENGFGLLLEGGGRILLEQRVVGKTHGTDTLLRKTTTKTHTTNTLVRRVRTLSHTTNTFLTSRRNRSHTSDTYLRKRITASHTTGAYFRTGNTVTFSTSTFLRKRSTLSHSTGTSLFKRNSLSHSTSIYVRRRVSLSHLTSVVLHRIFASSHSTDIFLRKRNTRTHTTGVFSKRSFYSTHQTSTFLTKKYWITHSTSTVLRHENYDNSTPEDFGRYPVAPLDTGSFGAGGEGAHDRYSVAPNYSGSYGEGEVADETGTLDIT